MSWRLEITDADVVSADLDVLDRLDAEAEDYCRHGGVIIIFDMPWDGKRVLTGPGDPPSFLVSDSYPTLELLP